MTNEEIIEAVNKYDRSPYFGYAFNYSTILGGIKGNDSHKVVTANSVMYNFATTVDLNNIVSISKTQNAGTEFFPLDEENLVWQKEVIKVQQGIINYYSIKFSKMDPITKITNLLIISGAYQNSRRAR